MRAGRGSQRGRKQNPWEDLGQFVHLGPWTPLFGGVMWPLPAPAQLSEELSNQHVHVQGRWPAAVCCAREDGKRITLGKPAEPHQGALGREGVCTTPAEGNPQLRALGGFSAWQTPVQRALGCLQVNPGRSWLLGPPERASGWA